MSTVWGHHRDKLIHGYYRVNLKRVWDTVQIDVPPLRKVVELILTENEQVSRDERSGDGC